MLAFLLVGEINDKRIILEYIIINFFFLHFQLIISKKKKEEDYCQMTIVM